MLMERLVRRQLKWIATSLFVALFSGCLHPRTERGIQDFVPEKELTAVSLAREGAAFAARGRSISGELRLRQALVLYPGTESLQLSLATTLEDNGLPEESLRFYDDFVLQYPEEGKYEFARARALVAMGEYDRAMRALRSAIDKYIEAKSLGRAADAARSLSALAFRLGLLEESRCASMDALTFAPLPPQRMDHARVLVALGEYEQALLMLDPEALGVEPAASARATLLRALALLGLERYEDAFHEVEIGLARPDPEALAHVELAALQLVLQKFLPPTNLEDQEEEDFVFPEVSSQRLLFWPYNAAHLYTQLLEGAPQ